MVIDRYMVNLFFEIRRNLPTAQQRGMKISSPDLGEIMVELHNKTDDENIRLLVEVFLERAGGTWTKKLRRPKNRYRGIAVDTKKSKVDVEPKKSKKASGKTSGKSNYYRGVKVD